MEQDFYTRVRLLGQGAFGKAYLVQCKKDNTLWVIKQMDLNTMSEEEKKETLKEAKILEAFNHPNIVKFREVYKTKKGKLCIVMEYADGGDLSKKLKDQGGKTFTEQQVMDWFVQLCLAVKHVHDRKIIHRDLKCQNIFMTRNSLIKLGDFGIARVLNRTVENAKTMVGTPYYLSPEIIENKPYSFKTDVWSLGVILYELCALKPPFNADSLHFLALKIVRGAFAPIPAHFSKEVKDLISMLLQTDPKKRPFIHEILQLPIIKRRIQSFLTESQQKYEFSHTVLHNKRFVSAHTIEVPMLPNPDILPPAPSSAANNHAANVANQQQKQNYHYQQESAAKAQQQQKKAELQSKAQQDRDAQAQQERDAFQKAQLAQAQAHYMAQQQREIEEKNARLQKMRDEEYRQALREREQERQRQAAALAAAPKAPNFVQMQREREYCKQRIEQGGGLGAVLSNPFWEGKQSQQVNQQQRAAPLQREGQRKGSVHQQGAQQQKKPKTTRENSQPSKKQKEEYQSKKREQEEARKQIIQKNLDEAKKKRQLEIEKLRQEEESKEKEKEVQKIQRELERQKMHEDIQQKKAQHKKQNSAARSEPGVQIQWFGNVLPKGAIASAAAQEGNMPDHSTEANSTAQSEIHSNENDIALPSYLNEGIHGFANAATAAQAVRRQKWNVASAAGKMSNPVAAQIPASNKQNELEANEQKQKNQIVDINKLLNSPKLEEEEEEEEEEEGFRMRRSHSQPDNYLSEQRDEALEDLQTDKQNQLNSSIVPDKDKIEFVQMYEELQHLMQNMQEAVQNIPEVQGNNPAAYNIQNYLTGSVLKKHADNQEEEEEADREDDEAEPLPTESNLAGKNGEASPGKSRQQKFNAAQGDQKQKLEYEKAQKDCIGYLNSDFGQLENLKIQLEDALGMEKFVNAYNIIQDKVDDLADVEAHFVQDNLSNMLPFLSAQEIHQYMLKLVTLIVLEKKQSFF